MQIFIYLLVYTFQISMLFTFLARQIARQNCEISINGELFERVLESLCGIAPVHASDDVSRGDESSRHEERQQALLELLATSALKDFDERRLLTLAEAAKFYRVVELIYTRRREFDRVLTCYCCSAARSHVVFDFIQQTIGDKSVTDAEKARLKESALKNLEKLIEIDADRATKSIVVTIGIPVHKAFEQIKEGGENAVYEFLRRVFDHFGDCLEIDDEILEADREMFERYVELLCKMSTPEDVVAFLQTSNGYRTEVALETCRKFCVTRAVVFLLEKSGNIQGAFELAIRSLRSKLSVLVLCESPATSDGSIPPSTSSDLETDLACIVGMLHRRSSQLERSAREELWFSLIDVLIESFDRARARSSSSSKCERLLVIDARGSVGDASPAERTPTASRSPSGVVERLQLMIQSVVAAVIFHVAFDRVIEHLLDVTGSDADTYAGCFGNVRDLLIGVINSCRYERETVIACSRVVNCDVHSSIAHLAATASNGVSPQSHMCASCYRPFGFTVETARINNNNNNNNGDGDGDEVVCFRCGHAFHRLCLLQSSNGIVRGRRGNSGDGLSRNSAPSTKWRCLTCANARTGWTHVVVGRPRVLTQTSTSSARSDSRLSSTSGPNGSRTISEFDVERLSAAQEWRRMQSTSSRLKMLAQLNQQLIEDGQSGPGVRSATMSAPRRRLGVGDNGLLHGDRFRLKLSPPLPPS